MLFQAAADLGLKLSASWMVGDLISDVLAGLNAGCRSILVASGQTPLDGTHADALMGDTLKAPSFADAAEIILNSREDLR
jgi:D-glycero-D-manno-heptose 1,7-bisphosphate phosphatase